MEAYEKMKKENKTSFMKNVLMLMIAQVLIKVLGFVYRLLIMNVEGFGDVGNGYYNAGYQVYSLLLTISSVGIPTVISKLVSERVAVGDNKGAHRIFITSLKMFTIVGLILSFALFFGAGPIARRNFKCGKYKIYTYGTCTSNSICCCIISFKRVFLWFGKHESNKYFSNTRAIFKLCTYSVFCVCFSSEKMQQ